VIGETIASNTDVRCPTLSAFIDPMMEAAKTPNKNLLYVVTIWANCLHALCLGDDLALPLDLIPKIVSAAVTAYLRRVTNATDLYERFKQSMLDAYAISEAVTRVAFHSLTPTILFGSVLTLHSLTPTILFDSVLTAICEEFGVVAARFGDNTILDKIIGERMKIPDVHTQQRYWLHEIAHATAAAGHLHCAPALFMNPALAKPLDRNRFIKEFITTAVFYGHANLVLRVPQWFPNCSEDTAAAIACSANEAIDVASSIRDVVGSPWFRR
jgi:hypothetical protein